jgi:hypothetical protein
MRLACLLCLSSVVMLAGCRSRYVEATVHNGSGAAVTVVEVDYPSASFGKEMLDDGADFHYRFKVQGDGATKVLWTDKAGADHTFAGPVLHEGAEGSMYVTILAKSALWQLQVKSK